VLEDVVEAAEHEEEVGVAGAQADEARARRVAREAPAGALPAVAGDDARHVRAVPLRLIRVLQPFEVDGVAEVGRGQALEVGQLDVAEDAAGEVGVGRVESRVDDGYGHAGAADGQVREAPRQVCVGAGAREAGRLAARVGRPLQSAVAVERAHRREPGDLDELCGRGRDEDDGQDAEARAARDAEAAQRGEV
jgi:hypothetical protein